MNKNDMTTKTILEIGGTGAQGVPVVQGKFRRKRGHPTSTNLYRTEPTWIPCSCARS